MKPFMTTMAIVATVTAPLTATPAFAGSVQTAPNGSYAVGSQGSNKLAPHWHQYHNWRSRNAYQTRLELHKETKGENGSQPGGQANQTSSSSTTASTGIKVAPNGDYALNSSHSPQLAPHWYGFHNWRTRNAFQTRVAMQRAQNQASNTSSGNEASQG